MFHHKQLSVLWQSPEGESEGKSWNVVFVETRYWEMFN
jgi:hypothetical protein